MAAIVITITTAYAQIFDTNGRNGWGTVTVRPSQSFEYTGTAADTFTVTDASKTVTVEDGVITAVDGVAATTLTLSPSDGASNNPVVYYVVDINVNGTTQRKYWVLDYAASTSVAWSSVEQLPSADNPDSAYNQLITASDPLPQYMLKSDTVDAATIGTASDGRGYIGRLDSSTGKFPTGMIPSGAAITGATVSLTDAGGYFTTDNAEAALQQIASTSTAFISTARIQADAVTNPKLANMATQTIKGRNTAGTGDPEDLTASQAAGIVRAQLLSDAIANGETSLAPTQNAVYDALLLKMGALGYEDAAILHAGSDWQSAVLSSSGRRYFSCHLVSVSAGSTSDYQEVRLIGDAGGDSDGATAVQTYKSNAGVSTVTVRCWYTTVY
jgi:hypothetical protein